MADRDEDRFRPRVGPPKAGGCGRPPRIKADRFTTRVLKAASKASGGVRAQLPKRVARPGARLGRGDVAAQIAGRNLDPHARRAIVKARLVVMKDASPTSIEDHLDYIEREGVTQDGRRGRAYAADTDAADRKAFEERLRGDRHQFRFIVSPEDAGELRDLRSFTRQLMSQMERDLGTRLDWVAVDHWDTDNPHTHILLRGKDEAGQDLVIARDYISHGMRARVRELATEWLGPRTELEIRESLVREVRQDRWTSLDESIRLQMRDGILDLRAAQRDARRELLIGRTQHLAGMGLAVRVEPGVWALTPGIERTLRVLGEHGDVIRNMQRAFADRPRDFAIFDAQNVVARIVGRVASKGLAEELRDQGYLVVDAVDGQAHYVSLPPRVNLSQFPIGAIVEVGSGVEARLADRAILAVAEEGTYRVERHLALAREREWNPDDFVRAHVRRLEALRRAGIVERVEEGVWRVPPDLTARGRAYDAQRARGARVEVRSHLPIEQQVRAIGATWLDRQLIDGPQLLGPKGFGADVRDALAEREAFLVEQGFAERRGQRVILMRNLLATLRGRDVDSAARTVESETGLTHRPVGGGGRVAGVYRRSIMLASGRFAMLEDGAGFSLVPWRPVIERRLGQHLTAWVRSDQVSWEFALARGLGR